MDPPILNLGLMWIQTNNTWVNDHISWKPYFEPNFWRLKGPILWSVANHINSNQWSNQWNQNVWHQTNCISRCRAISRKPNFGPNSGLKSHKRGPKNFFDSWYYLNLLDIIVVYHNMQNKEILMSSSQENEFGDKNYLETSLNGA